MCRINREGTSLRGVRRSLEETQRRASARHDRQRIVSVCSGDCRAICGCGLGAAFEMLVRLTELKLGTGDDAERRCRSFVDDGPQVLQPRLAFGKLVELRRDA